MIRKKKRKKKLSSIKNKPNFIKNDSIITIKNDFLWKSHSL